MQPEIKSIYDLISLIKHRPAMYIGDNKLSTLKTFLDGFCFALTLNQGQVKETAPIPFWFFHEWVAKYHHWRESTAGWKEIILDENNYDETKSLYVFFELFEQFSQIKIISSQKMLLNQDNIDFHYKKCPIKRRDAQLQEDVPVYLHPTEVNLFHISDFGFIFNIVDSYTDWEHHVYKTETDAKEHVARLFGRFSDWI